MTGLSTGFLFVGWCIMCAALGIIGYVIFMVDGWQGIVQLAGFGLLLGVVFAAYYQMNYTDLRTPEERKRDAEAEHNAEFFW